MSTTNTWYSKTTNTGNHQGLVVEETTGKNIAVTYDAKHAPLVASAPEMLEVLLQTVEQIEAHTEGMGNAFKESAWYPLWSDARAAIAKATT